jgi:hypothetical protein
MSVSWHIFRLTMTIGLLCTGAVSEWAYAQASSASEIEAFGAPHQLTMPPHEAAGIGENVGETNGAVSVLPNGRSCPADIGVLDRAPVVAPAAPPERLRNGAVGETEVSSGCRPTATDTNPPSILAAPPNGTRAGVPNAEVARNGSAGAIVIGP